MRNIFIFAEIREALSRLPNFHKKSGFSYKNFEKKKIPLKDFGILQADIKKNLNSNGF